MNNILKTNKTLIIYSLIVLIAIPIFGINLFLSFVGNILILLFLIPLLFLLVLFVWFNSFKSKINQCNNCGAISFGINNSCMSCGSDLENISNNNQFNRKPSESTIEVKAEEVK